MDPATIALTFRRVLLAGILGLALLIPASVIPGPGSAATCAASTNRIAVVAQHLDGVTLVRCVGFAAASIKVKDALDGSGLDWRSGDGFGGLGLAVCQVDGEPATFDASNCLKASQPFWALFVARAGGGWQTSSLGISSLTLHDGDAFGLRYQPQAIQPQPPTAMGTCSDPTPPPATPKPTPKPTLQPTPRPTATPTPPPTTSPANPGATGTPSAAASETPSPSDDGIAVATTPPSPGLTTEPAASQAVSPSTPVVGAPPPSPGGGGPFGLVLVVVAGLAFAALGVFQIRRSP